jgi:hypothetical protein
VTGPGEVTVHRAPFADDLLPVLDTKTGEVVAVPLAEVARDTGRYRFTADGADGGLYECNYPHPSRPSDDWRGSLQHELDATERHAGGDQLHCRTACWTCHDSRVHLQVLDLLAGTFPVPVPADVIEERTDIGLPKGHYGRGLLDQLAKSGELEEAGTLKTGRRLWRLTAATADPAYAGALRAALYPGRPAR